MQHMKYFVLQAGTQISSALRKLILSPQELHTIFTCAVENIASRRDYVPAALPPSKGPRAWHPA